MVEIVCNLYEMEGISKVTLHTYGHHEAQAINKLTHLQFQDTAEKNARTVFDQLDIDRDGELNEDEFVKGCMKVFSSDQIHLSFDNFAFRTQTCRTCSMGQQNDLKVSTA